jgi:hypothetical protein
MIDKQEFTSAKNKLTEIMESAVGTNDVNIEEFANAVKEFISFVEQRL